MAISTNGTVLARLAGALYNTQMSNATYKEVASLDPSALADVLYARDFSAVTDATVATTLVTNLGLTAVEGLANWVAAQLTAAGSHKGAKVVELLNGFAQMSADATYGAAATAFNTKVDAALALSQTTDNAGGSFAAAGVVSGKTFTLTTSANAFNGTSGDDTFSGTAGTIDGDVLAGGNGDDTLSLTVTVADDDAAAFNASGIETVSLRSTGGTANDAALIDIEMGDVSGLETLDFRRINDDIQISNLQSLDTTIAMSNNATAADVVVGFEAAVVTGSADTANVTIDSTTGGADLTINGVETIAVTVVGEDNDLNIDGDDLETVTIAGAGDLNIDVDASATTVDASENTGGVTVNFTAAADVEATGGSGADTFSMGTTLTADDVFDGGEGADTLAVTGAGGAVLPASVSLTSVETLSVTTGGADTLDANRAAFDNITITAAANAHSIAITDATDEVITVRNGTAAGAADDDIADINIALADATGEADSLTVNLTNRDADNEMAITTTDFGVANIETVTLNFSRSADIADASEFNIADINSSHDTLLLTGTADVTIDVKDSATDITSTIVGDVALTVGAVDAVITMGSGDDTIAFAATLDSDDEVDGGEGDDTLTATPGAGVARPTVTNVENIQLNFGTASASVNMGDITGATTLNLSGDEAHVVSGIKASVTSINLASTDADGGETATLTYASGVTAAVTVTVGDVVDGTAGDDVDLDAVNIATYAGALTLASDGAAGNTINGFDANTATSLTVNTAEDLTITGGGDDDISATAATSVLITTAGGVLVIDDDLLVDDTSSITLNAADGNLTITGDVFSDANAAASTTNEFTDVTLTADDDFTLLIDGVLDVEYARNVAITASNAGDVEIDGLDVAGTDGDGDAATVTFTLTTDAEDSTINFDTGTASGAATIDLITVVSGAGSTANITEVTITNADTDLTITEIDASQAAGDLVITLTTSNDAVEITTGSGDATIIGTTAADTIVLGSGDNTVETQDGADEITCGDGTDSIIASTPDDTVIVNNFDVSGDQIVIDISVFNAISLGDGTAVASYFNPTVQSTAGAAAFTLSATTSILKLTGTYANSAAMELAIEADMTTNTAVDGDDIVVIWTDGADSYVSAVDLTNLTDGAVITSVTATTALRLVGVSISDLTATDFTFQA